MINTLRKVEIRKRYLIYIFLIILPFTTVKKVTGTGGNMDGFEPCERCVLLTDNSEQRIIVVDLNKQAIVWEWKPSQSNITTDNSKWFDTYSDVKPVYENKYLLISTSAGGIALIRVADKKVVFYSYAGGNTHSIELFPDGNIVSASSTGNYLMLFHVDTINCPDVYKKKIHLQDAHNVVWDKKRELLWAAGKDKLYSFKYNFNSSMPNLILVDSIRLPDTGSHDLFPMWKRLSLSHYLK